MAKQVQFRRGTSTEHGSFTGAVGEITFDTTLNTLRAHDGSTAGGTRLARYSEIVPSSRQLNAGTGLTGGGNFSSDITLSLDTSGVSAGTYGSATEVAQITVDAYGRVTSASSVAIQQSAAGVSLGLAVALG
jgi:hypothetical protein